MGDAKLKVGLGVAALAAALIASFVWAGLESRTEPSTAAYAAPGFEPMAAAAARDQLFVLLPALLGGVYDAFARTEEGAVYDTLAVVAAGAALETLYLERAGAMLGGGLDEADQAIHEMRLTNVSSRQAGETFQVDARWEVIGTVGHSEHLHVRGATYSADLTIAPVDGAWRITDFDLTDVDRRAAGEFIEAERAWWN